MSLYAVNVGSLGGGGGGSGSVTSVGLADGSLTPIYTITNSPVTSAGTLTFTLNVENANKVFAGPTTGADAEPTFRSLVAADLPSGTVLSIGAFGSTPNSAGGSISAQVLTLQPADGSNPGGVSTTTQTFVGQKTFSTGLTGTLTGHATLDVATSSLGNLTDVGTDGIVITGGTGAVVGSVSLAQHVADTTHNGYLSSTDWNTFNGKTSGGITSLTGDVTASGPGAAAATLATVNTNVGSFTPAAITVNGKGLVTAASSVATGNLTDAGTDGITITGGTGAVLGSGTSIAQHVADTTHNGYLSSTDWNTFNGKGAGSVTSVALSVPATSILDVTGSPVTTSGTLGLTTTGTSGGVPYFSSTSQLASSALLTTNALMLGGGAGGAPAVVGSLGTTTTVLHGNASGAPTFGAVSLTADVSGILPIANGGTAVSSVTTAPAATAFAGWDANKNLSANNHLKGFRTQATANSTLALVIGDTYQQYFTGTTAGQIVTLPTTSVAAGFAMLLVNSSTQTINVQSSGGNSIQVMAASTQAVFTALVATPTTAANWSVTYSALTNAPITNSLSGDVNLSNTGTYFDGPSIAQGTSGVWFVSGTVVCSDTAGTANYQVKLWDGTTVIASAKITSSAGANTFAPVALSGYISSPAGNLRISVNDITSTSGLIKFNSSGNSKDSTITAMRIG